LSIHTQGFDKELLCQGGYMLMNTFKLI